MLQLGQNQQLTILRETDPGLYLGSPEGDEVLLPHKYKPEQFEIGDPIDVFVYLDHEERPVATTLEPYVKLNEFGFLQCSDVNKFGAFMDWGLEKQLFVPFKEQARPMKIGNWYIVYLYLDDQTNRLTGSSKTNKFLNNDQVTVSKFDEVDILVTHITEKGANAIVNGIHKGLIYIEDIFEDIRTGDRLKAYVRKVRQDNKIDIVLQTPGYKSIEPNANYILDELKAAGGFMPLHDKTDPEVIKNELGISKKSFKKAIGSLFKDKQIRIKEDGIELI
ncbi:MAG: GntR family transcriptional regulator [Bacteroidia bacterium]|nr:GntR family transcriptional regulator [Bacteroidia bacterium]NNF31060.1 GntR family transcriptional regulator [Flavobacteriaceae bacterium]MBT8276976.1 GntR family transcriptional regulator [Bacteroidia bacterium]NNJ81778.1 GntR family transcriptional regulator [Flavobacteriaceae bacterium]NNK55294.1 GntR family transcriptional regulator [Flavobacteriaceae bacterium]